MTDFEDALARLLRAAGPPPGPDAATLARLRTHAQAQWRSSLVQRRRARARTWALAAAVVLALALVLPLSLHAPRAVPVAYLIHAGNETLGDMIERGSGASRRLPADVLAAGDVLVSAHAVALRLAGEGPAALRVDAGSRLRWRGARELELLAGRVYVDSGAPANDLARALEIVVGDARVRHIGTQYLTAREADTARVVVREGRVRIDLSGSGTEIGRGEAAAFATAGGPIRSGTASLAGADWSWAEALAPRVPLEGRDLRDVLIELARETGRPLRFASAEVERQARETILHGPALDVPPADALQTLLATSGFDAATDSTSELVVAAR